ncbi:probable glucan 1,3-beta-glucosidase A isoform X1 [Eurytemora carolleeae]|uniref:probable glucan 1,3-beta-glucosidase A isoform X1 n=1 Tax=Eurytemora carolleeae TaxID=1294199 RepID=UPI000C773F3F|nr:probable glucan 1,3-beta-glucosidase A isoform X1 [Eurytemora carolleeae]|eukprot:XP_023326029.1 probable glucan 1,3-beta-glucosidase A isoform X1 [Eurytemora affinis]
MLKIGFILLLSTALVLSNTAKSSAGCGDGKVRGVNLGGWLVLEPWITPKFFEEVNDGGDKIVDEYTYAQYLDPAVYKERMVKHWDTFYTKEEFAKLAASGIEILRIPIAYWYWDVIEGEPFPQPNMDDMDPESPLFYLRRALGWMEEYGLKASFDLHTGPESQNGYDNSGRRGEIHWVDGSYPGNRMNLDRTVSIVDQYAQTIRNWVDSGVISIDTVYGIGILNEPHVCGGWNFDGVLWPACIDDFYPKAHDAVRKHFSGEEAKVVVDVAGRALSDFDGQLTGGDVDIDAHNYQCFGGYWNEVALSADGWGTHISASCQIQNDLATSSLPVWVGEFSLAVTECQKYLSGGYQVEYHPPDSPDYLCDYYNSDFSTYSEQYKDFLKQFFLAQIDSFESAAGWVFWTAKTEDHCAPEWDYLFLLENGIVPADLCNRDTVC